MNVGRALREVRKNRGMTARVVCELTGITQTHLSLVETGKSNYSSGLIVNLCKVYEIPVFVIYVLAYDEKDAEMVANGFIQEAIIPTIRDNFLI